MEYSEWIRCPVCGSKTRNRMRKDTVMQNYPLFCPKCRQETLIEIRDMRLKIVREPDAKIQKSINSES